MRKKSLKHYKVGLDSETYKISMVTSPALEVDYVALAKEQQLKLSSDERHICYGPALIPNLDIYRNNGETEYYLTFTEESIVKMSQEFMKNYRQHEVNLQHEENVDEVFVCESWLVEDPVFDKAKSLGFDVPKNTWMIGLKVNNVDTWERVKSGELRGFSCEAAVSLEDFSKNNNNDNYNDMNEEMLFSKIKNVIKDFFKKEDVDTEASEASKITPTEEEIKMEEQTPTEPVETPVEPVKEPSEPSKDVDPTTTKVEENKEPTDVAPEEKPNDNVNHLEELIETLKKEVEALKGMNKDLTSKVKSLEKEPSVKPVNTNSKPNKGDTYDNWRQIVKGIQR